MLLRSHPVYTYYFDQTLAIPVEKTYFRIFTLHFETINILDWVNLGYAYSPIIYIRYK